ncbi:DUF2784 domain-containing protein [Cryptosporangium minutisporangium]|uniref:DUF2784 domain-containing protein n=1 Tax=Cryptosporangium minutisporangium TaxID=113569 RepID=A0ABP6SPZ6_9ACTN
MGFRVLACVVMVTHFAFMGLLVFGGCLAWRWPRALALHVPAVLWAVTTLMVSIPCPLTRLENALRARGSWPHLAPGGFLDHYIEGVWFPEEYTPLVQAAVAVAIAASWVGVAITTGQRRRITAR